jgi:hypothetical protein
MWIQGVENAAGVSRPRTEWVRTVDGWQSRHAVEIRAQTAQRDLHPGLVAAFVLGASMFCLVAFPARVSPQAVPLPLVPTRRRGVPAGRAATAAG